MQKKDNSNDLTPIITQALLEMKAEQGDKFSIDTVNLAELGRRTGISRGKLRRLQKAGFVDLPHGNAGTTKTKSKLSGFTGIIDNYLRQGITNSSVIFEKLLENGFTGKLSIVKDYIHKHKDELSPPRRQAVSPQGNRGRRYDTAPGESFQMDWGFVNVKTANETVHKVACFAMICHHCGERYIEFFPNAKQENLFIGMIHAFAYMGIPKTILTDNMKSVVIRRDSEGKPIWQRDYEVFMKELDFQTKLCKPYHPFTKGAVERLVQFVKGNFLPGRIFNELTDLNYEAIRWCNTQNRIYHKAVDCIPHEVHRDRCLRDISSLKETDAVRRYLCPERRISFDGFVNYEGRRFGVPYFYTEKVCRVQRDGYYLYIYSADMKRKLVTHEVTWSRKDSYCRDQYVEEQPEEKPTATVKALIHQASYTDPSPGFEKFNFAKEGR